MNNHMKEVIRKKHRAWERYSESKYNNEEKYRIYCRMCNKVWKATRYLQKCQERGSC